MDHCFGNSADESRDDGFGKCHRVENGRRKYVALCRLIDDGRQDKDVTVADLLPHLRAAHSSDQLHLVAEVELDDFRQQRTAQRTVPNNFTDKAQATPAQLGARLQQNLKPFQRQQSSHTQEAQWRFLLESSLLHNASARQINSVVDAVNLGRRIGAARGEHSAAVVGLGGDELGSCADLAQQVIITEFLHEPLPMRHEAEWKAGYLFHEQGSVRREIADVHAEMLDSMPREQFGEKERLAGARQGIGRSFELLSVPAQ
jgi:hypothetical protein